MSYTEKKARAELLAIDWQSNFNNAPRSWGYCITWAGRFYRIGRKYGLIRVFRENGILQGVKMFYYKFVNHDVGPAQPEFFTHEKILEKFKNGITFNYDLFQHGFIKSDGWLYDFKDDLKHYLVKQYGQWSEYYAPNKTLLRRGLYGRIEKIIDITEGLTWLKELNF